jgi:hypothetical protein
MGRAALCGGAPCVKWPTIGRCGGSRVTFYTISAGPPKYRVPTLPQDWQVDGGVDRFLKRNVVNVDVLPFRPHNCLKQARPGCIGALAFACQILVREKVLK